MSRTDLIPAMIIACCVLHNVCRKNVENLADVYEREGENFFINIENNVEKNRQIYEYDSDDDDNHYNDDQDVDGNRE